MGKRTGLRDERAVALELVTAMGWNRAGEDWRFFGGLNDMAVSQKRKLLEDKFERDSKLDCALTETER